MKFRTKPVEIESNNVTVSKQYEKFESKDYANFFPEFEKLSPDFIELFERMYNEDEQKRATLKEIETLKWVCEGAIPTDKEIQDEIN